MDPQYWHHLSIYDQMSAIGAEIGRTISWRQNPQYGNPETCFYRGLEYLDLSISDPKNRGAKLKELCRLRELLADWYLDSKLYTTSDLDLSRYFTPFSLASNYHRSKLT